MNVTLTGYLREQNKTWTFEVVGASDNAKPLIKRTVTVTEVRRPYVERIEGTSRVRVVRRQAFFPRLKGQRLAIEGVILPQVGEADGLERVHVHVTYATIAPAPW